MWPNKLHSQYRTRQRIFRSTVASLCITLLLSLPILGERFNAAIYQFVGATSSSAATSPIAQYHRIVWVPGAGVSACTSIKLELSNDGVVWNAAFGPVACTAQGVGTSAATTARYYKITVAGLLGGALIVGYSGYDSNPDGAGVSTVTVGNTVTAQITGTATIAGTVTASPTGTTTIQGTVTATPTGTTTAQVTNTTTVNPVSVRCEDTTGTAFVNCGPTSVSVTSGTIGSITMPSLTVTSGTIGQLPSVSVTSGTIGNTVTTSPTGTQSINVAQVLAAALSTANPVITGGRGSTTVPSAVADAAVIAQRLSKYGDTVIVFAPPDLESTGTIKPTTTAATQIIASSGATTAKWHIMSIIACNLAGNIATEMDITDSTNTIDSFVWSATAVAGEPRCIQHAFPDGYPTVANSSISGKLTVSDASGVFVAIKANKTGT